MWLLNYNRPLHCTDKVNEIAISVILYSFKSHLLSYREMNSGITLILAPPFINTRHHINAWYDIDSIVNQTRYILRVLVHHPCRYRYPILFS